MQFLKVYGVAVLVFFAIDLIWLGVIAKNLYQRYLGYLLAPEVNWTAAIVFYLLFVAGMVFFVINPALEKGDIMYAILAGGLFGFITYATYDLTNLATIRDWPLTITIIDLIWGTVLSGLTSTISFLVVKTFLK
ncbi:DUF2177 family protein [Alkalibacter saccharofermentans]|uniref:Uncharacterized membrane protein n=1 Tax=Alkalibacter saccharofermentans DSM 14828 TaxID=1120975 RepID=A0A1M4SL53_9FIRM|nr:DUF2177 family protein [Alkalibacter saccharofermentans]SHE32915.1 Uncharacterized membrane protein [Alkalibacter saccharofermentans DSM 14828]